MTTVRKRIKVGGVDRDVDFVDVGAAFPQARVKIGANDVTVDTEEAGGTQFKLIARCGETTIERIHAIGGTDPATIADNIDAIDEQRKIDEERVRIAAFAERGERARQIKKQLT